MVPDAGYKTVHRHIIGFIADWLQADALGTHRVLPERSWAWKTSYLRGVLLVQSLREAWAAAFVGSDRFHLAPEERDLLYS